MALPAGWTSESAASEVLEAGWRSPPLLADTVVRVSDAWWQMLTPSLRQGGFNEISHVRLAEDVDVERWLDARIAEYHGAQFRFVVTAETRPADLAERLERRGFRRGDALAMARDLSPIAATDVEVDVDVELVADDAGADVFTTTSAAGWSQDPAPLRAMHRLMARAPSRRLYVARVDGEPAGTAATMLEGRSAYLIGAVTLPAFRHRGVYHALVARRIADASRAGAELATSQARAETSAPILAKLGFETVARFTMLVSPSR